MNQTTRKASIFRVLCMSLLALAYASPANAQIKRNGVWQGSDLQRGNPHGLASEVLHREPAPCTAELPVAGRGVYEDASWENDIIPFIFNANVTITQKQAMFAAMEEVTERTKIMFVKRGDSTTHPDYIEIIASPTENNSSVGRIGGRQEINIFNWNFKFIMVHELMHAIGIWHEQSASDRDSFVTILPQNIEPGKAFNFDIRPDANIGTVYDYNSVMHYGQFAFSTNPGVLPTILTNNPAFQSVIGQTEFLSNEDVATLRTMHGSEIPTVWYFNLDVSGAPDGTFTQPYGDLLTALSVAPPGARVVSVHSGFHLSNVTDIVINQPVVLNGSVLTLGAQ